MAAVSCLGPLHPATPSTCVSQISRPQTRRPLSWDATGRITTISQESVVYSVDLTLASLLHFLRSARRVLLAARGFGGKRSSLIGQGGAVGRGAPRKGQAEAAAVFKPPTSQSFGRKPRREWVRWLAQGACSPRWLQLMSRGDWTAKNHPLGHRARSGADRLQSVALIDFYPLTTSRRGR